MFLWRRLPCVKGAVERMRDGGIVFNGFYSFTTPPSFSCENANSPYTGAAYSEIRLRVASTTYEPR